MRASLFVISAVAVMGFVSPCSASSAETDAFVANTRLDALFLEKSSRLASDHSDDPQLRSFAAEEGTAADDLIADVGRRFVPEVAQTTSITVASNEIVTGRSAAVDREQASDRFAPPVGTGALMPAAIITLDHLASRHGQAFDMLFKATQIDALRQLAGLYNAYSLTGDDAALRQLAKTQLAATNERIAEIGRL